MAAVPGIDVSSHQGMIDWSQVAASGQKFVFIRSSMGRGGVDSRFSTNFRQARDNGLLVGVYHLIRPEWRGAEQMDHFLATLSERKPDLPLVLDVELDGSDVGKPQPPEAITACVREAISALMERGQRKPIIYTGAWFWNEKIIPSPEWGQYDLWVAHYGATAPKMPIGWTDWKFWQYSDRGSVPGVRGHCDLNWFDGTLSDLLQYASGGQPVDFPRPKSLRARVTASMINVRKAPDAQSEDIGDLFRGDLIEIHGIGGRSAWIEFEPGQWAAFSFNQARFMEWQPGSPPRARVTAALVNVRSGAGVQYDKIGELRAADLIDVLNIDGSDVWIEFEPGQWAALVVNGRQYMELVRE
jgi:GH25 family lysozyme M1 (1,4-beta-N-acetylmuramidase)